MRYTLALLSLLVTGAVLAATSAPPPPDVKPVPDGPPGPNDAPPIKIKPSGKGRVEEYRANGRVYMLKVTPKVGKPYYLIDQKGEGFFTRRDTFDGGLQPPMWKVKEFE
jgi:hypothetical protein